MTFDRNNKLLVATSITLALIYVIWPTLLDSKADYGRWVSLVEGLWMFYIYVLPGIFGIAVALLLRGSFGPRFAKLVLTLGLPIVVAFLLPGKVGLDWGSFQFSMIILAFVSAIYVIAGGVTAFVASRKKGVTQPSS